MIKFLKVVMNTSDWYQIRNANKPITFQLLDLLRGFAAISVLFWHYQHFYYQTIPGGLTYSQQNQPFFNELRILYSQGGRAVQVFWVISGFVLMHTYLSSKRKTRDFFVSRIARLYPLHLITLIFVSVLQLISMKIFGHFQIYSINDFKHFLLNILFIPKIGLENGYSFNAPFWSVSVELIAYIIFGLTVKYYAHKKFLPITILILSLFLSFFGGQNSLQSITTAVFFFYSGVFIYQIFNHLNNRISISIGILFITFYFIFKFLDRDIIESTSILYRFSNHNYFVAFFYSGIILSISNLETILKRKIIKISKFTNFIGNLTYSTYLWHIPIQIIAIGIVEKMNLDPVLVFNRKIPLILYLASVVLFSRLSFLKLEKPTRLFFKNKI